MLSESMQGHIKLAGMCFYPQLIGLSFEVHASYKNKQAAVLAPDGDAVLRKEYQNIDPSFVDMMAYSYCYIGLFTGETLD